MGQMVWSLWANYISLTSAAILFAMGIEGAAYPMITFEFLRPSLNVLVQPAPILQILLAVAGLLIASIEWPLGSMNVVFGNYAFRSFMYAIIGVLGLLVSHTVNGGIYLIIASACFAKAAMNGEQDMKPARRG